MILRLSLILFLFATGCTGSGGFSNANSSPSTDSPAGNSDSGTPDEPQVPPPAGKVSMTFDQRFFDPEVSQIWKVIGENSDLNLGEVPINSTDELKVTLSLKNMTENAVNVSQVRVPAGFALSGFTAQSVAAGESLNFDVSVDKSSTGERRGVVEVTSSGGTFQVKVVGVVR